MIRTTLSQELQTLDAQVLHLGTLVEQSLADILEALPNLDTNKAGMVIMSDAPIDELHLAIEMHTHRIICLQQPLGGRDLRELTATTPIAIDLERIGDEAVGIAQIIQRLQMFYPDSPVTVQGDGQETDNFTRLFDEHALLPSLVELGQEVRSMLHETMDTFRMRDVEAARRLWFQDTIIDKHTFIIQRALMALLGNVQLLAAMKQHPHLFQRVASLLQIAYYLGRVSDHCTNICERIVYIVKNDTEMSELPED